MPTTVRLPLRLEQTLAQYCAATKRSKSEVIIEALERQIAAEMPLKSAYETACASGFIGAFLSSDTSAGDAKTRVKAAICKKHGRAE